MKLLFSHIPKCAGQSVNQTLLPLFSSEDILKIGEPKFGADISLDDFKKQNPKTLAHKKIIRGHVPLHIFIEALGASVDGFTIFTIVRHPLERVISQFNYIRRTAHHPGHLRVKKMSIDDYILRQPHNFISSFLCEPSPKRAFVYLKENNVRVFRQEKMEDFFNFASKVMGRTLSPVRVNFASKGEIMRPSPEACDKFCQNNHLDLTLVNRAMEL